MLELSSAFIPEEFSLQYRQDTLFSAAFHGTPATFAPEPGFPHGRFRLDEIGTGEGAQVKGWGIYIAEARGVGESYKMDQVIDVGGWKRSVSKDDKIVIQQVANEIKSNKSSDLEAELRSIGNDFDRRSFYAEMFDRNQLTYDHHWDYLREKVKSSEKGDIITGLDEGSLYELDVPDNVIPKLLDLDEFVSDELFGEVVEGLKNNPKGQLYLNKTSKTGDPLQRLKDEVDIGNSLYEFLSADIFFSDKDTSEFLNSIGIPGSKFLDQNSRIGGRGATFDSFGNSKQLRQEEKAASCTTKIRLQGRKSLLNRKMRSGKPSKESEKNTNQHATMSYGISLPLTV